MRRLSGDRAKGEQGVEIGAARRRSEGFREGAIGGRLESGEHGVGG